MILIKKYKANKEIVISGMAGPVIREIGKVQNRIEKNLISIFILLLRKVESMGSKNYFS